MMSALNVVAYCLLGLYTLIGLLFFAYALGQMATLRSGHGIRIRAKSVAALFALYALLWPFTIAYGIGKNWAKEAQIRESSQGVQ